MIRKVLKNQLVRWKGSALQNLNRIRSVEAIFSSIYANHRWGDEESASGKGSKVEQTQMLVPFLPKLFQQYRIESVLDIPCGDFNWMQYVNLSSIEYYGADIVPAVVRNNIALYTRPNINFFAANILKDELPRVDLVLSRDCFVHFSDRHVYAAIQKIKVSGSEFLLATTFPDHNNFDIVTGSWRPINLQRGPFWFPQPLELFNEGFHPAESGIADKSLALWRIADLP